MRHLAAVFFALALASPSLAQHEGHGSAPPQPRRPEAAEPEAPAHDAKAPLEGEPAGGASERNASGTSWQPDYSPAWGWHFEDGERVTMVHGLAFLDYVDEGGPRGDEDFGLTGWAMVMTRWRAGEGHVTFRGMVSPEAATWGEEGYPELFQVGEALDGQPLVDRQHPHDLFMELAVLLERPLGATWKGHLYLAPSGEPALGPPAFPHRASAAENPRAPLGHHQQDSTHISFGVVTLGVSSGAVRVEASAFNGREPDQERYDLDLGALDSYSVRVAVNPSPAWSLQASAGHLVEPEELKPGMDADRVTFSVQHGRPWGDGYVASSLTWGRNDEDGEESLSAVTLESTISRGTHSGYARLERAEREGLAGLSDGQRASVTALTLGYVEDIVVNRSGRWGLGGHVTLHDVPRELEAAYGESPVSVHVFGRWRPPRMTHGSGGAH